MPDDYDDETPEPEPERKPNFRRELERKAAEAEAEADRLKRENAIYKAGITGLNEDQFSVLQARLTDDLSSEAVTAQVERLGWATAPEVSAETVAAHEAIDRASAGSTGGAEVDAHQRLREAMAEGGAQGLVAEMQKQGLPTSWDTDRT